MGPEQRKRGSAGLGSCYYSVLGPRGRCSAGGGGEVEEPWWLGQVEGVQDGLLAGSQGGALCDRALRGGQGDQVHPVELVADVAPGVAGGVLGDPDEQQGEPAEVNVAANPVFAVVEHRPQAQGAFHVSPAAFNSEQLLVRRSEIFGGQRQVGGAQQPLAVQVRFTFRRAVVDA